MIRGSWIPPVPLALGALSGIAGWILVILYAVAPSFGVELAWIHAVALGSFTTIALSVLIHAIPGFTDLRWRMEPLARSAAVALPFVALALVVSFAWQWAAGVAIFGLTCVVVIASYLVAVFATLQEPLEDRTDAAIARAMTIVFVFLTAAIAVAAMLASAYAGWDERALQLAPSHAILALVGWLTLLTMGVSARTLRPLLGSATRWPRLHVASNGLMALVALAGACAAPLVAPAWMHAIFALGTVAALVYALDGIDRVMRATNPHRPAHALVTSAFVWLIVAALAATFGAYQVAIVVALAGWLGQMINAHLHHLGIRVISTTIAGDDDETRPWQLLDPRLTWTTLVLAQLAVLGLLFSADLAAGIAGLGSVAAFALNVRTAIRKVHALPRRIPAR